MVHYFIGDLGHLFVILSFVAALVSAFSYFKATTTDGIHREGWLKNARTAFYVHSGSVLGVIVVLFTIIYNHYYEYHYAWAHSSNSLPTHYMISCFWEGQEGSFLLWIFWHALLGVIIIHTNKYWEAPTMAIFAAVQVFLASMILGVVIPGLSVKIGSSPFVLLRDALPSPIFNMNPEFVPEDGTGLNPLLQNYWMVIHPPTLFLGYAAVLVPFAYALAGLWQGKYKEWIRPALPWAIFAGGILGLGILMGGYWAYETLNFGGYWNWDPVENAVYIPWLFLIGSIHTMISYRNSQRSLKTSFILIITTFVLILYGTFLVRSGVLGDSSVHSFTDLGLSGQLLMYLCFFTGISIFLLVWRWNKIPTSDREASAYSREFWIFIGAMVLCLAGFQVLVETSKPVYNSFIRMMGGVGNMAPRADAIEFYSNIQLWFAVAVAFLSGAGQFFWWKREDGRKLKDELLTPAMVAIILSIIIIPLSGITNISYIVLLIAGTYSLVANLFILTRLLKTSPSLSGGAVAHIGVAMMLIGILFSSGYSKVVSLNNTGLLISRDQTDEFNNENLLLFINEPRTMAGYEIRYKGPRLELRNQPGFINKFDVERTADPHKVRALRDLVWEGNRVSSKGDLVEIYPENTYYEIEYKNEKGKVFTLYPRAQVNESMGGLLASPDIKRRLGSDLYTHVSSIPIEKSEEEWSELEEVTVPLGKPFFVNDYVATLEKIERAMEVDGVNMDGVMALKATVKVQGEAGEYIAEPYFLVKGNTVAFLPDVVHEQGVRFFLRKIHPETDEFTIGFNTTQKDWVVLKALEKPLINVLWIGTLVLMAGFGLALARRYTEFRKMRDKNME